MLSVRALILAELSSVLALTILQPVLGLISAVRMHHPVLLLARALGIALTLRQLWKNALRFQTMCAAQVPTFPATKLQVAQIVKALGIATIERVSQNHVTVRMIRRHVQMPTYLVAITVPTAKVVATVRTIRPRQGSRHAKLLELVHMRLAPLRSAKEQMTRVYVLQLIFLATKLLAQSIAKALDCANTLLVLGL
jgi:hypothetical protein